MRPGWADSASEGPGPEGGARVGRRSIQTIAIEASIVATRSARLRSRVCSAEPRVVVVRSEAPSTIQAGRARRVVPAVRTTAARPTSQSMNWGLRTRLVTTRRRTIVKMKSRLTAASARSVRPSWIALARNHHHRAAAASAATLSHLSTSATASPVGLAISQAPNRRTRGAGSVVDQLPQVPGRRRDRFLLQAPAALLVEEGREVAERDRRDEEHERDRHRRRQGRDQQAAAVPLAEQEDDRPDLDRGPEPGQGPEPGRAAMDHDQGRDPDHGRDDVEPEDREGAEEGHRDQPDPDAGVVAARRGARGTPAARGRRGRSTSTERDEGGAVAGGADPRDQDQERRARRVLPGVFVRDHVFVGEDFRPAVIDA